MHDALLIEDAPEYQILVRSSLATDFNVTCASSAEEALEALAKHTYALILIDVGLPGRDGMSLCEELRRDPHLQATPILFVTGRRDTVDVVQAFAAGADDYIQKPFHPDELRARVEASMRRAGVAGNQDNFWKADLHFVVGRQRVAQKADAGEGRERDLGLTPNEFKILYHLVRNEGKTLSRAEILKEVWGEELHVVERTVDKHICSLRRKMMSAATAVASVPGEGYVFELNRKNTKRR